MSLPKTPRNTIIARHKPSNTAPNPSKPRYQPATMALPTSATRFLRVSSWTLEAGYGPPHRGVFGRSATPEAQKLYAAGRGRFGCPPCPFT
jgi:hypothetical protein